MEILKWTAIGIGLIVGIWLFDRMMLALEARGHIYWRKKKASPGTVGNALLELQSITEPSKKHVLEQRLHEAIEADENADPIDPVYLDEYDEDDERS